MTGTSQASSSGAELSACWKFANNCAVAINKMHFNHSLCQIFAKTILDLILEKNYNNTMHCHCNVKIMA